MTTATANPETLYEAAMKFQNGLREDLSYSKVAAEMGWDEQLSEEDVFYGRTQWPHDDITFVKGETHIWKLNDGSWQCAYVVKGHFRGHHTYPTLLEALKEEDPR